MNIELTSTTGFPLFFDPESLSLTGRAGYQFYRITRKAADLAGVFMSPSQADPQIELYYMDIVTPPAPEQEVLDRYELMFSTVLLPALQVGGEFVKTHGHYHPSLPGSAFEFPEIYTQLYGTLLLLMQKRSPGSPDQVEDCVITTMTPGYVITIPPGYAHILINTTSEPTLMAGLYGREFKPDYEPVRARQGLAYYVASDNGGYKIISNPRYSEAPPLRWLGSLSGTIFEPPFPSQPVWQAYMQNPDGYAFLTQAQAVQEKFFG